MISEFDIVQEQIKIANNEPLSINQDSLELKGHSIECRINAENPAFNFAPSPGVIKYLNLPSGGNGLRVDTALFAGGEIPPYYDAMIAKVITHGKTREIAIAKMKRALKEMVVDGIQTNLAFQLDLLDDAEFINGKYDTEYLENIFIPKWQNRLKEE